MDGTICEYRYFLNRHLELNNLDNGIVCTIRIVNASWDRECGRGLTLFQTVTLKRWYIVFPNQAERDAIKFIKRIIEIGRAMGFEIGNPRQ